TQQESAYHRCVLSKPRRSMGPKSGDFMRLAPKLAKNSEARLSPATCSPRLFPKAVALGIKPPGHRAQGKDQQQGQADAQKLRRLIDADHRPANAVDEIVERVGPKQPMQPVR